MKSRVQCLETFRDKEGLSRYPNPGEACCSCGHVVPKTIPTCAEPPALLIELLKSKFAVASNFCKNIRYYNSAKTMALVRAKFVSRGPRFLKYNPTNTVHGRMYQVE